MRPVQDARVEAWPPWRHASDGRAWRGVITRVADHRGVVSAKVAFDDGRRAWVLLADLSITDRDETTLTRRVKS